MEDVGAEKVTGLEKSDFSQLVAALQNPARGPFPVIYEIFASPQRKKFAYLKRELSEQEKRPAHYFVMSKKKPLEEAEIAKKAFIDSLRAKASEPGDILERLPIHAERYRKLTEYFQEKIKSLGLEKPLIFFDDKAFRIDVGYGQKEFNAIFPDFPYDIDDYIQRDYLIALESEQERIIQAANIKFNEPLLTKAKIILDKDFTETMLIKKCLEESHGLVIGEMHHEKSPKQFLIDNMSLLKSLGVTTLYMEHLMHERHQPLLDAYLKSPADAAMPRELEIYLERLDKERRASPTLFTAVVRAAKKNGIRVIAIDTDATYQVGVTLTHGDLGAETAMRNSAARFKIMNMAMFERFSEYNDGKKYVALVGNGHVSTCLGVPGVSDLLGCPNIVVHDLCKEQPQEKIEQNIEYKGDPTKSINFDFLYHRVPGSKLKNNSILNNTKPLKNVEILCTEDFSLENYCVVVDGAYYLLTQNKLERCDGVSLDTFPAKSGFKLRLESDEINLEKLKEFADQVLTEEKQRVAQVKKPSSDAKTQVSGLRLGSAFVKEKNEIRTPHQLLERYEDETNKNLKDSRFKLDANSHSLIDDKTKFKIEFYPDGSTRSDLYSELNDPSLPQNLADIQIAVVKTLQTLLRETNGAYPKEITNLYLIQENLSSEDKQKVAKDICPRFTDILRKELLKPEFNNIRRLITIEGEKVAEKKCDAKVGPESVQQAQALKA